MMQAEQRLSTLDPKSFSVIADLAYRESGLQLVAEKTSMIQSRLRHRLRELGMSGFQEYVALVCSAEGVGERRHMISALTTNVSHFFREKHHFEVLVEKCLPALIAKARSGGKVRLWSAGCSNGQEAYSIAITVLENFPELGGMDFKILASDIDPNVVEFAKSGVYPERLVSAVPPQILAKYFRRTRAGEEPAFEIIEQAKSLVAFKELNLLSGWPMRNPMDVIFCRNVVIYFDLATQNTLWPRLRRQLTPNGYLFLGHSERISEPSVLGFVNDGPTTYRPTIASHSQ